MTQRQITLVNNSASPTALAILQNADANRGVVAWLAKYAYPGMQIRFTWDDDTLCFVWAATGQVAPGVIVDVSQTFATNPVEGNQIELSYDLAHRTFFFRDPQNGRPGTLSIRQDNTLPVNAVVAGIGMAGKPTVVAQANPNLMTTFMLKSGYFLAAGAFAQGEVIDTDAVRCHPVAFPPNVFALTATLDADGQWSVVSDILTTLADDE